MKNKKLPSIIILLILTAITVVFWVSFTIYRVFTKEEPVVVPLLVRIQPDVVEVALVAVQVEVQRVAVAVLVHEEMYAKPSMPLSIEYSLDCIVCGIENPPASRTKELCL